MEKLDSIRLPSHRLLLVRKFMYEEMFANAGTQADFLEHEGLIQFKGGAKFNSYQSKVMNLTWHSWIDKNIRDCELFSIYWICNRIFPFDSATTVLTHPYRAMVMGRVPWTQTTKFCEMAYDAVRIWMSHRKITALMEMDK